MRAEYCRKAPTFTGAAHPLTTITSMCKPIREKDLGLGRSIDIQGRERRGGSHTSRNEARNVALDKKRYLIVSDV